MDQENILSRIEEAKPDILLVAFGNPKQEKWIAMHRHRLKVPVCIGVGGSFDFLSGGVSRAPLWMQRNALEWLYRTIQEPSRLAKRYASNFVGLLRYLPAQIVAMAMQTKRRSQVQITNEIIGPAKVLRIDGHLTGAQLPRFETDVRSAIVSGSHVVLDMSSTAYIGADALGTLIRLLTVARSPETRTLDRRPASIPAPGGSRGKIGSFHPHGPSGRGGIATHRTGTGSHSSIREGLGVLPHWRSVGSDTRT